MLTPTALVGASGSGKSTLLHLIGAMDTPDSGNITVDDINIAALPDKAAVAYRRTVGFVFQRFHLIPTLSVLDNVTLPAMSTGRQTQAMRQAARDQLERVGLSGRDSTMATKLSGGQQQRVAIARSLMGSPRRLLADEPTGSLDSKTGADVAALLLSLSAEQGITTLLATHDRALAELCDAVVTVADGKIAT